MIIRLVAFGLCSIVISFFASVAFTLDTFLSVGISNMLHPAMEALIILLSIWGSQVVSQKPGLRAKEFLIVGIILLAVAFWIGVGKFNGFGVNNRRMTIIAIATFAAYVPVSLLISHFASRMSDFARVAFGVSLLILAWILPLMIYTRFSHKLPIVDSGKIMDSNLYAISEVSSNVLQLKNQSNCSVVMIKTH